MNLIIHIFDYIGFAFAWFYVGEQSPDNNFTVINRKQDIPLGVQDREGGQGSKDSTTQ